MHYITKRLLSLRHRRIPEYQIYNILRNIPLFEVELQTVFSSTSDNREPNMASSIMGLYIHPAVLDHLSYRAGYLTVEVALWNCVVWQQTLRPIC